MIIRPYVTALAAACGNCITGRQASKFLKNLMGTATGVGRPQHSSCSPPSRQINLDVHPLAVLRQVHADLLFLVGDAEPNGVLERQEDDR